MHAGRGPELGTDEVVAQIEVGGGPHTIAVGEGGVWVTNRYNLTMSHIDPGSNQVVATVAGAGLGPSVGVATGSGSVWVAHPDGIARVDPRTDEIADILDVPAGPYYDIVHVDGDLWVSRIGAGLMRVRIAP